MKTQFSNIPYLIFFSIWNIQYFGKINLISQNNSQLHIFFISSALLKNADTDAWIGLFTDEVVGNWHWVDGSRLSYTNWNPDHVIFVDKKCVYVSNISCKLTVNFTGK